MSDEPGPSSAATERPDALIVEAEATEDICPFPGLRPFKETESHLFFGRETQRNQLLSRLQRSRFLAIVGTSGTGKSSLVYAGLIPALRSAYLPGARARWRIVSFNPGDDPLGCLERELAAVPQLGPVSRIELCQSALALARKLRESIARGDWTADTNLLIHVDQFEELFRLPSSHPGSWWDERDAFVKLLLEASDASDLPLYVVLTMRSEYLGDCATFRGLPEAINEGQFLVPRMTREHWRMAIEQPVRLAGDRISPQLVQRLLNDVASLRRPATGSRDGDSDDQSDELPLLQHALRRTWQEFNWRRQLAPKAALQIDIEDYENERVGTIHRALSVDLDAAAKDAQEKVPGDGLRLVREIFLRLRVRDNMGREARDPVYFHELCRAVDGRPEDLALVIDQFREKGRTFLQPEYPKPFDDDSHRIDIPHECLLRRWRVLRDEWVPQEEEKRRTYLRLALAADDEQLLTGARLQVALEWWTQRRPTAAWAKRYDERARETPTSPGDAAPVMTSFEERFQKVEQFLKRSTIAEEDARHKDATQRKRDRLFKRVVPTALVVIAVLASVVVGLVVLYRNASRNERDARRNWSLAVSHLLASRAQLVSSNLASRPAGSLLALAAIRFSEDTRAQAAESGAVLTNIESRAVLTNNLASMARPLESIEIGDEVTAAAVAPDGVTLVVGTKNGEIRLIGPGHTTIRTLRGAPAPRAFAFAAKDRLLIATHPDRLAAVEIWHLDSGNKLATLPCANSPTGDAAIGPDDEYLMLPCGRLYQWPRSEWRTGAKPSIVGWASGYLPVRAVSVQSDGLVAVGGEQDKRTQDDLLIYSRGQSPARVIPYATGPNIQSLLFLPNERLAVADNAATVRIWTLGPARDVPPPTILSTGSNVVSLSRGFSENTFLTFGADGTVRLWNLGGAAIASEFLGQPVGRVAVSQLTHEVSAPSGGRIDRWNVFGGDTFQILPTFSWAMTPTGGISGLFQRLLALQLDGVTRASATIRAGNVLVRTLTGINLFARGDPRRHVSMDAGLDPIELSPDGTAYGQISANTLTYSSIEGTGFVKQWEQALETRPRGRRILFSSDSRTIALVEGDTHAGWWIFDYRDGALGNESVSLYDAMSGTSIGAFELPGSSVLQVFPNRELLMLRSDGAVAVFDTAKGRDTHELLPPEAWRILRPLTAVSRTGSLIALGRDVPSQGPTGAETQISIWNADRLAASWPVDGDVVRLTFSDDERYLATTEGDGRIRVFEATDGRTADASKPPPELSRIEHPERVVTAAFSPDSKHLVVLGERAVRWYLWKQDDVVAETCARTRTSLTPDEWRRYIPEEFLSTTEPYRQRPCTTPIVPATVTKERVVR